MQILREQTPEEGGGMFRRKGLKNVQQCSRLDIEVCVFMCVWTRLKFWFVFVLFGLVLFIVVLILLM